VALLADLDAPAKHRLDALLNAFREASPAEREATEDALLDFFLDHDHDLTEEA
jgi:hypothetical protein